MSTNRTRVGAGFQGERGAPSLQPFSSLELSATPSFVPEASWSSVPPRNGQLPELLNGILPVTQLLGGLSTLLTLSHLCALALPSGC